MKIKEMRYCDSYFNQNVVTITFNDIEKFVIADRSSNHPEDCTLSKDLRDAYNVIDMLKEVYEFGKKGVEITFEKEDLGILEDLE